MLGSIDQGVTDRDGHALIYGAEVGLYTLTSTPDFDLGEVHAQLHFASDPQDQPAPYASQDGTGRQQIALTYDPIGHNYTGTYPLDIARSLDFQYEVALTGTQGAALLPYRFQAAQYHTNGPSGTISEAAEAKPAVITGTWNLFPPEAPVRLNVDSSSLLDGTGVMGGRATMPADPPNGLLAVGGPYTIQGENPISSSVHLSLDFQSEYFCGLVAGSAKIYRHNGIGWEALSTALNEEWHVADAPITQWGIYGDKEHPR